MDYRLDRASETLLQAIDEINGKGFQSRDMICDMEMLLKSCHYVEEIRSMESGEDYDRGYGRRSSRRDYGRSYNRGGYDRRGYENEGNDMKLFLEDSMRNAKNEQERDRIRRLMNEY